MINTPPSTVRLTLLGTLKWNPNIFKLKCFNDKHLVSDFYAAYSVYM